jgi:uncharacterized protein (TIGR02265 family)
MATEKVVFEQAIEGLFVRALGPRLTPDCKARLKVLGLDVDAKLLPAYSFDVWMKALEVVSSELYPTQPLPEAMFKVGSLLIAGYQETFLGRAVLGMIRVLGPRRMLMRATQNFRSANNYTESRVTDVDAKTVELWMNEVGPHPTFTAGIVYGALAATGVTPSVVVKDHDGHACTFVCTWT